MKHELTSKPSHGTSGAPWPRLAKAFVAGVLGMFAFACAPTDGIRPLSPPVTEVDQYADLNAEEREIVSESLADEGEQKLSFSTLDEAWGKFSDSLKLNPENQRAILWKEFLKPIRRFKGIVGRVRPLYMSQEGGAERYHALMRSLRKSSNQEFFRYVSEGTGDVSTDEMFRSWMDLLIVDLDNLRTFLKANRDREYQLRAPVKFLSGAATAERQSGCATLRIMTSKFAGCPSSGMLNFKVNRADIETMNGTVSYMMLSLAVMYAYNFNPTVLFMNFDRISTKDLLNNLAKGYDGGLLERNHLHLATSVAGDWLGAQRYFVQNQKELCRESVHADENRPGFLMAQGVCMDVRPGGDGLKTLDMLEMMVQGQPVQIDMEFAEHPVAIYPLKFFAAAPKTGTVLYPVAYDEHDNPASFNDSAYSPYFAAGTITDVMKFRAIEAEYYTMRYEEAEKFRQRLKESRNRVAPPEAAGAK